VRQYRSAYRCISWPTLQSQNSHCLFLKDTVVKACVCCVNTPITVKMHIHPVAMKAVRRQDVDVEVVVDIEDEDMAEDVIVRSVCNEFCGSQSKQ
jgi:hypothetical protein